MDVNCTLAGDGATQLLHVAPGHTAEAPFDLTQNMMWYDVTLTSPDESALLYQFAGRIETGQPGRTDPAMGAAIRADRTAGRYPIADRKQFQGQPMKRRVNHTEVSGCRLFFEKGFTKNFLGICGMF